MLLQAVALLALLLAVAAFQRSRTLSRRFDALNQSYWELKFDYTRLRSQISRLDPDRREEPEPAPAPARQDPGSFVPLSAMRKKEK